MSENKVAVGCLSCYNEGRLTFKWMNADELEEANESGNLAKAVCNRPDDVYHIRDEWEIQDYIGDIFRLRLGGWPDIKNLIEMMRLMDDEPYIYVPAYMGACDRYGGTPDHIQVQEVAENMLHIGDQSIEDYFMEQAYDCGDIKNGDPFESYIDWEHYARDQMYDYTKYEYGHETYLLPNY